MGPRHYRGRSRLRRIFARMHFRVGPRSSVCYSLGASLRLNRRYTVLIADRSTGVVRRLTISLRGVALGAASVMALPILIGLGARWSGRAEIDQIQASNALLQVENSSYRVATG